MSGRHERPVTQINTIDAIYTIDEAKDGNIVFIACIDIIVSLGSHIFYLACPLLLGLLLGSGS